MVEVLGPRVEVDLDAGNARPGGRPAVRLRGDCCSRLVGPVERVGADDQPQLGTTGGWRPGAQRDVMPGVVANFAIQDVDGLRLVQRRGRADPGPQPEAVVAVGADAVRVATATREQQGEQQRGDRTATNNI